MYQVGLGVYYVTRIIKVCCTEKSNLEAVTKIKII